MAAYKNLIIGNVEVVFTRINQKKSIFLCPYFLTLFRTSKHGFVLQTKKATSFQGIFGGVVRFPVVVLLKSEWDAWYNPCKKTSQADFG